MRCATASEAGPRYNANQDRVAADPDSGTFVVADGMGGLTDGATTAQMVVDELPWRLSARLGVGDDAVDTVTEVLAELNEWVRRTAVHGPGTTGAATALVLVRGSRAVVAHLGDSRVYLARHGRLVRLTDDHARAGQLTRFVGMPGPVTPDVAVHPLCPDDRLLLCTDGLTGAVSEDLVLHTLGTEWDGARACRALVGAARAGGSTDDVSVITVDPGCG